MNLLHLLYHQIVLDAQPYTYATTAARFHEHLRLFREQLDAGTNLEPVITFDDGHRSFYDHALPALAEHRLHAHLFITAGWVGERAETLTWPELRDCAAAGHTVGAHSWSHALLTHLGEQELHKELVGTRSLLEDKLGFPVTTLSFPGGRYNRRVLGAARAAGYLRFFTSAPRLSPSPPLELTGRVNILQSMDRTAMHRLLTSGSSALRRLQLEDAAKSTLKQLLGDRRYAALWSRLNHQAPPTSGEAG